MWSIRRLWPALLVLALIASVASLFGPRERWWGVDIGATGAALFHLTLLASVLLVALRPREVFPEQWSLDESRAWLGLAFTSLVLLGFVKFMLTLSRLEMVPTTLDAVPVRHFVYLLTALFIAWGVMYGVLVRGFGPVERDERDLRMQHDADRAGDWALTLSVIACVSLLINVRAAALEWWLEPMILANVLVGLLIVKGLVEYVALVVLYARARR